MRVRTDVYSLADVTAEELRWARQPWQRWPCLRDEDVGPKELARLGEVLGVGVFNDVLGGFSFLAGESQESPWVVALPERLARRLVEVADDEIMSAAVDWSEALDREIAPPADHLATYLRGMVDFLAKHDGPYVLYVTLDT